MSLALHRLVVARQTAPRLSHASIAIAPTSSYSIFSTRFHSTFLTMSSNPVNGSPARGSSDGSSRKRQYPFPNRNRNRTRRGPAQAAPFSTSEPRAEAVAQEHGQEQDSEQLASSADDSTSFASLAKLGVNPILVQTLVNDLKLSTMTPVQAKTLPETLAGHDVLAQAKTGTGKTFAFLIPALQRLVGNGPPRDSRPNPNRPISVLVISPTRELALQIAQDSKRLLARFPGYSVQYAVGGLNPNTNYKSIMRGCDVLIATPGRVLDYLGREDGQFRDRLANVQTIVLDEADRLMDMGFLPDIRKIVGYLAPGNKATTRRQGMLFSATINERVQQFATDVIDKNWKLVSTIPKGEVQTHDHVPQHLIVVPEFSDLVAALIGRLRQEIASSDKATFKSIVFCPTAAQVDFYAHILGQFSDLPPVSGVSSRLSQAKRNNVTDTFRRAKSGVLIATDVIARGLDFPNVTHVYQVGVPSEKEAYIHRLGRTGRAGAEGQGTLLLTTHEAGFTKKSLPMVTFIDTPADLSIKDQVFSIVQQMEPEKQAKVYRAWLGYYRNQIKPMGWKLDRLVVEANKLALNGLGCAEIPGLEPRFVGKAGLKGTPGLRIVKPEFPQGGAPGTGQNFRR